MVGLRRYTTTLLVALCGLTAIAQVPLGTLTERQLRQLTLRSEKIHSLLEFTREAFLVAPNDSLSQLIHTFEKQAAAVDSAIERLLAQQEEAVAPTKEEIADHQVHIEQEVVAEQPQDDVSTTIPTEEATDVMATEVMEESPQEVEATPMVEEVAEVVKEQPVAVETPTTVPFISDNLKSLFGGAQRRYALTEREIDTLIMEYTKVYEQIGASLLGYEKATNLKSLEGHYADYLANVEQAGKLADQIADRSDLLITSKTNAYLGFADSLDLDSLRAIHTSQVEEMEVSMTAKFVGKCSDLDLAMYPHRLRTTMTLEAELARHITPEVADSLAKRAEEFDMTYTLFNPISTPKRSNAKFAGVVIKKKVKEAAVSSLPVLKIPSEGELYSITVANYASLPPSTNVFRGATPLYRERREDGRTYVYIGLYPTAQSAQDDIALLRKTGFKQPTLVMWRDGIRRDDFVDKNAASTTTASKTAMYRIEIAGANGTLPADVLTIIKEKAPRKEISKYTNSDGAVVYTLGIFTSESEATALSKTIAKSASTLSVNVLQIGKK